MEFIPVVILIALVIFTVIWAISPKMAGKAAIKTFAFIVAILLVASMLAIPGIVRADEVKGVISFITPIVENGEAIALVDVDCNDGNYWQYKAVGRIEVGGNVKLTIIDGKVKAVEEAEEENLLPAITAIVMLVLVVVFTTRKVNSRLDP